MDILDENLKKEWANDLKTAITNGPLEEGMAGKTFKNSKDQHIVDVIGCNDAGMVVTPHNKTKMVIPYNDFYQYYREMPLVINIAEILKDVPKWTKLYSPAFGGLKLDGITDDNIIVTIDSKGFTHGFFHNGKYYDSNDTECMIFPSKYNRDWSTFSLPEEKPINIPFQNIVKDSTCLGEAPTPYKWSNTASTPEKTETATWIPALSDSSEKSVYHPDYYNQGNIECIDAMISAHGKQAVIDFCICNAEKYLWRYDDKENPVTDLNKALWYINKAIKLIEGDNNNETERKINAPASQQTRAHDEENTLRASCQGE